jgi:hypothetical protein
VLSCCLPEATYARTIKPNVKLFDYIQPNKTDGWTKYVVDHYAFGRTLASACKNWLDSTGYDGLVLDEPFTSPDGVRLCAEIANAIAPRVIIPNYGDFGTFTNRTRYDVQGLIFMCKWAFIQVAIDTTYYTPELWATVRTEIERRLGQGKTIIAGIFDPDGFDPKLAAILSASIEHERLFWHYATAKPPLIGDAHSQVIDPWWNILRGA